MTVAVFRGRVDSLVFVPARVYSRFQVYGTTPSLLSTPHIVEPTTGINGFDMSLGTPPAIRFHPVRRTAVV